jgi:hypothetical protein
LTQWRRNPALPRLLSHRYNPPRGTLSIVAPEGSGMTTRLTWLGTLALAILNVLTAQAQQPVPHPVPAPMAPASHSGIEAAADLVRAAHHLEAAGAGELAAQVRQKARQILDREATRLAHEQAALEQLSRSLPETHYMIQAMLAQVRATPDQFKQIVQEVAGDDAVGREPGRSALTLSSDCCSDLLRALGGDDESQVQILSRPQVVTTEGRPASIMVGNPIALIAGVEMQNGTVTPLLETDHAGVSVTFTATSAGQDEIHLDGVLTNTSFLGSEVPVFSDPLTGETWQSPVKDMMTAISSANVRAGETLVIAVEAPRSANSSDDADEASMLILFATPQVVGHSE